MVHLVPVAIIGGVATLAGIGFELHKRAKGKVIASTAAANAATLQPSTSAAAQPAVVGPSDPAQSAAQAAAAAAALAGGPTLGQQQMATAASATNKEAAGNADAVQQAAIVLATPDLIEGMEKAAGGISLQDMETIAASAGTSVQNMLAVSFVANPGADPAAVSASVAQTIAGMK